MTNATQFPLNSREWAKWLESRIATIERSVASTATRISGEIAAALVYSPDAPSFAMVPVGGTIGWYGESDPTPAGGVEFMIPDGRAISRTDYATLFALIGTTHGAGNGTTTFNIPNEKGRTAVARDSAQTEFDTMGETGGAKTITLTASEIPSHTHAIDHDHPSFTSGTSSVPVNSTLVLASSNPSGGSHVNARGTSTSPVAGDALSGSTHDHSVNVPAFTGSSGSAGGGGAHGNLQPYIVRNSALRVK